MSTRVQPSYERLSALDASMIFMETSHTHMHIGAVGILKAAPLNRRGGLDTERIRAHIEAGLDEIPRYRQRLAFIPIEHHPVWIDDEQFNLDYHVHFDALPRPGSERQLKRMIGRVMSQKLDLTKPLWELWIVEGLEGGQFAMVQKVHHCMADGMSAVNVLAAWFSPDPNAPPRPASEWVPHPVPDAQTLLLGELRRRAGAPFALLRSALAAAVDPVGTVTAVRDTIAGLTEAVASKLQPASDTPVNVEEVGSHRRFDWLRFDLGAIKELKNRLGGKVNDVVLAIVSGAIRRYLEAHGRPADGLDFRVVMPVNTRPAGAVTDLGNRVVPTLVRLPLEVRDPLARLQSVCKITEEIKASKQIHAIELFEDVANFADAEFLTALMRRATRWWAGNLIVTNVPGPQVPLYFLGAQLLECYPFVPMMANQALCLALLSYDGGLYWGFNADWDAITDLHDLVGCFEAELADLQKFAGVKARVPVRSPRRSRPPVRLVRSSGRRRVGSRR